MFQAVILFSFSSMDIPFLAPIALWAVCLPQKLHLGQSDENVFTNSDCDPPLIGLTATITASRLMLNARRYFVTTQFKNYNKFLCHPQKSDESSHDFKLA